LIKAYKKIGLTSEWIDKKNHKLGVILESTKDNEDKQIKLDAKTAAKEFIQKIY
jgi:hypothetical protein